MLTPNYNVQCMRDKNKKAFLSTSSSTSFLPICRTVYTKKTFQKGTTSWKKRDSRVNSEAAMMLAADPFHLLTTNLPRQETGVRNGLTEDSALISRGSSSNTTPSI